MEDFGKKMVLPFDEEKISSNTFIRTFYYNQDSEDYKWHRDLEDRIIESIYEKNWMYQLDNELPKIITGKIFIPNKGV